MENLTDLFFKGADFNNPLCAGGFFAFGAVVILVPQMFGVFHLFDRGFASWARGPIFRREFVFTHRADDLFLDLSRNRAPTLAAAHQAGIGKGLFLRTGASVSAQKLLDAPEFVFGDHGFMPSLIPVARSLWILEHAAIERIGKDAVKRATCQRQSTQFPVFARAISPFAVEFFKHGHRSVSGKHLLKGSFEQGKSLRVFFDLPLSFDTVRIVQVAGFGNARIPALFDFGQQSPLDVVTQIPDVLVGHAEFHAHHQHVISRGVAALEGPDTPDDALLERPGDIAAIYRITRQPVQFPAQDALCFAPSDARKHLVEHGPTGSFGRL